PTPGEPAYYLVRREAVITGRDLKSARAGVDPTSNAPDVEFTLNPQGAEKFKRETGRNINRRLAIILDGLVASAPETHSQISDRGIIAGVILTIGVGVDTNVLIFERIREELRNGKTVRAAINNGFERVWITILDTHATALIAAAILFQFGTGPVKGFAVTLVMGLVAN